MNVINTLGTSPPVVTQFVDWLNRRGIKISKVVCIGTRDNTVKRGFNVIREALFDKFKIRDIKYIELPFSEPINEEDFYIVIEKMFEEYEGEVIINLSGGRKNIVLAAYLFAMLTGSKAYHIIYPDAKSFNIELERVREELNKVGDNPELYEKYKEKLEKVLFPDPKYYNVVEIPVLPFPYIFIEALKGELNNKSKSRYFYSYLKSLGYIQVSKKDDIILTEKGEKLLEFLNRISQKLIK